MTPFLRQVARHYFAGGDVERICFVFPNRRASVFFKKYFAECVAESGIPVMSPKFVTMNDFFYEITACEPTDQVHLLLELFDCYCRHNPKHESLDDFIFWGGVLLSDFDDVDKYLVRPEALFANVAEFRDMQAPMDFLEPEQQEAILRFVSHFKTGGKYKDEFRRIWDLLLPLYKDFNESLRSKGFSYEGMVYRDLAERLEKESAIDILKASFGEYRKFVFVGLNALNNCEKRLLTRLRDAGLAEFCWDYSGSRIKDPSNKSSFFMADNVLRFPQAFQPDPDGLPETRFTVLSVPSSVGQAKQIPQILERLGARGIDTAVVLPDESQLLPVLNSVPAHLADINVTMGYPMNGSGLWSLMNDIASLQMHLREKDGVWHFYHKQVWAIFSNSVFKTICGEEELAKAAAIRRSAHYYIPQTDLSGLPVFDLIFQAVVRTPGIPDEALIHSLQDYQSAILVGLAPLIKDNEEMAMELDFAREYHLAIGRLRSCSLPVLPATYFRLLDKLVGRAAVPFKGEPLRGLQIMGPLETRALDFDNVVILNCNEAVFPRRNVSSSFIPAELRKGFELPTYEYQDAVWAYYFYRMICRAKNVWMLFDSRTEGLRSGEESRYIKQLEMHFEVPVQRLVAKSDVSAGTLEDSIQKTQADIDALHAPETEDKPAKCLSATALQNYIQCPAKFYYSTVKGLHEQDEVSESLDQGSLGRVFHEAMQLLYTVKGGALGKAYLKSLLESDRIRETVAASIMKELNSFEVSGRNLIYQDIICRYVRKSIEKDIARMEKDGKDSIRILGLELRRYADIGGFKFKGFIDRLDSITPGTVRVVDYKTGKVTDEDFIINDKNAEQVVCNLFGEDDKKRPKIALQLYLYDEFVKRDPLLKGKNIVNSIYHTQRMFTHEEIEEVELCDRFVDLMRERVSKLLAEIDDLDVPFRRRKQTSFNDACEYCDFKTLCGR